MLTNVENVINSYELSQKGEDISDGSRRCREMLTLSCLKYDRTEGHSLPVKKKDYV